MSGTIVITGLRIEIAKFLLEQAYSLINSPTPVPTTSWEVAQELCNKAVSLVQST